jgi:hypothetical protein
MPELALARELAPDYAVQVDRAALDMQREDTAEGRAEQARRVQWLAVAAQAEAERIAILREVPALEVLIEQALLRRTRAERERIEREQAQVLARMAAQEQREAAWVFAAMASGSGQQPEERDRIWEFLLRRAQALGAAARGLGASGPTLAEVDLQLTAARTAKLPVRVSEARRALAVAQAALGSARAAHPPSEATRRDLRERLRERGFVVIDDAQMIIGLGPAGTAHEPPRPLIRRVALLDDLLQAFPHGPILLTCAPRGGCAASWFGVALRERVRIQEGRSEAAGEVVRVVLPAYAFGSTAQP